MKSSIFKKVAVGVASAAVSFTVMETKPAAAEGFSFIQGIYAEQTTLLNSFANLDSKLIPLLKEEVLHSLTSREVSYISSLDNEPSIINTEKKISSNSTENSDWISDLIVQAQEFLDKRVPAFLGDRVHRGDLRVYLVLGLAIVWISSWRANFQGQNSPPKQE
ncbi:MAG: hypothetical protein F6K36_26645 [Symploca sp. SIO3C6]|nr:hypothetical protein [Symploca sp. SIO3C6]NET04612.1 hypothetical protein [Symploca sp. SIO2B6]